MSDTNKNDGLTAPRPEKNGTEPLDLEPFKSWWGQADSSDWSRNEIIATGKADTCRLTKEIERLRGKVSILKAAGQKQRKEIVGLREEVGQKELAEAAVELPAEKVVLLKKETHVIHRCGSCDDWDRVSDIEHIAPCKMLKRECGLHLLKHVDGYCDEHTSLKEPGKGKFLDNLHKFIESDSGETLDELKRELKEDGIDFEDAHKNLMEKITKKDDEVRG